MYVSASIGTAFNIAFIHLQHSGWAWYTQSVFAHEMIVFICKPRVLWLQPYSRRYCYRLESHVCVWVYGVCTILHVFDICLHIYTCSKERDTCNRQASKLRYAEWEWTRVKSHTRTHLQTRTRTPSIHTVCKNTRAHTHALQPHTHQQAQQQHPAAAAASISTKGMKSVLLWKEKVKYVPVLVLRKLVMLLYWYGLCGCVCEKLDTLFSVPVFVPSYQESLRLQPIHVQFYVFLLIFWPKFRKFDFFLFQKKYFYFLSGKSTNIG